MNRGPFAEINLNAISENLNTIKKLSKNKPLIAVVKADAYGHGAVEVSRRLSAEGVEYLAVAFSEEAKELRTANINSPVLILFETAINDIFRYNLTPVVCDRKIAAALSKEAIKKNAKIKIHIKIDTGMGRMGITGDNAIKEILEIANLKGIVIEGIMSHFSDSDISDSDFTNIQIERFNAIKNELRKNGLRIKMFHIANSAAIANFPESHFSAVRPGLMIYGYSSMQKTEIKKLIPAMTVKTKILALRRLSAGTPVSYGRTFITRRKSIIGVIPVGYADGFFRRLSNRAEVIVRGRRVPVVGRVCMDLTMIDLTDLKGVKPEDEVIIIGSHGNELIDASEVASWADTIPYEVLTSLGNRARRIYLDTNKS